jgi:hypothetical protein
VALVGIVASALVVVDMASALALVVVAIAGIVALVGGMVVALAMVADMVGFVGVGSSLVDI